MISYISHALESEDGAVTVDWVVLCAAVVGLSAAAIMATRSGVDQAGINMSTAMSGIIVN